MTRNETNNRDILYQDNESAILLENNGRLSCRKGTQHIDIQYFYVTDMVTKGEVKIVHCPTSEMIADFFTKPLQGKLFQKFRDLILGLDDTDMAVYFIHYINVLKDLGLNENIT